MGSPRPLRVLTLTMLTTLLCLCLICAVGAVLWSNLQTHIARSSSWSAVEASKRDFSSFQSQENSISTPDAQRVPQHAHNKTHDSLDHPCAGPVLYGTGLVTLALVGVMIAVCRACFFFGGPRWAAAKKIGLEKGKDKYAHFWFARLEAAGLVLLTVAAFPVLIEYFRRPEGNLFWILSAATDAGGMCFICAAFIFQEQEIPLGLFGASLLAMSDSFGAYSAWLIGLGDSEKLGVVVLWFIGSLISASGCVFLGLCYLDFPCGGRLRLYFELACLTLFLWSGLLELSWGFCPVEKSSPNFFGSSAILNIFGYCLCLGALLSENWPSEGLSCRLRFPKEHNDSLSTSDENALLISPLSD